MQKLVKTGKYTEINKQSDVKFWLNWIEYGAVSYSLSCTSNCFWQINVVYVIVEFLGDFVLFYCLKYIQKSILESDQHLNFLFGIPTKVSFTHRYTRLTNHTFKILSSLFPLIFLSKHISLYALGRRVLDIIWLLNQHFKLKNQRKWLKQYEKFDRWVKG